ncbi:MAG: ABC transporter permease [Sedimentisphaerales bacterium]|nr:ABC transporter permease [Sedimentisphaerales bacterium]
MDVSILSIFTLILAEIGRFWRFAFGVFATSVRFWKTGSFARDYRGRAARGRLWQQMHEIGTQSVPVVMVTGAFVGMTLAVQGFSQFEGIGLQDRLGSVINISVVKELGPVLAALMVAGRVGGALTAELGAMAITDQINAVRAMGADPVAHLAVPRFLACVLLTPLLTVYADLLGVLGGYLITVVYFGVNAEAYWRFSAEVVEKWDLFVGIVKGVFFGGAIALISCFKGFYCNAGARGVGRACTEAFVYSFIAILALDFILAVFFKALYQTLWGVRLVF